MNKDRFCLSKNWRFDACIFKIPKTIRNWQFQIFTFRKPWNLQEDSFSLATHRHNNNILLNNSRVQDGTRECYYSSRKPVSIGAILPTTNLVTIKRKWKEKVNVKDDLNKGELSKSCMHIMYAHSGFFIQQCLYHTCT